MTASDEKRLFSNVNTKPFELGGTNITYITGDFSNCLSVAKKYKEDGYGKYNLFTNNCLHYVRDVLKAGKPDNLMIQSTFDMSFVISPVGYQSLLMTVKLADMMERVQKGLLSGIQAVAYQIFHRFVEKS